MRVLAASNTDGAERAQSSARLALTVPHSEVGLPPVLPCHPSGRTGHDFDMVPVPKLICTPMLCRGEACRMFRLTGCRTAAGATATPAGAASAGWCGG